MKLDELRELREAESLARLFHETYERLAPDYGYETRRESSVSWEKVPEPNRSLMIAVAGEISARIESEVARLKRIEEARAVAHEQLEWSKDFASGMFHVHCHKCGAGQPYLPPEFFGLLETADQLARAVIQLATALDMCHTGMSKVICSRGGIGCSVNHQFNDAALASLAELGER